MYKHFFKRVLDIVISCIALLLIGWFILFVALFLHFANKGAGAFFTQERPGKDGKIFKVIKFKTMTDEKDENGNLLLDQYRLTKVGKIVRSLSIDELPQLINVFKGDMSLIGPRPLLVRYLPLYNEEQMRRHEVRPGITGWAQVHGRNLCKLSDKFKYDVWYVDHCTLWTDIRILWMTVLNVLKRSDVGEGSGDMIEVDDLGFRLRLREMQQQQQNQQQNAQ
jgi:lipopolysaccharide/colanic/teichoic acid biosynthesis glycosyltransferase